MSEIDIIDPPPIFSQELKELIHVKQVTAPKFKQSHLARIVGVSDSLMSIWVNGAREITKLDPDYIKKLIDFAKTVPEYEFHRLEQAMNALPAPTVYRERQGPQPLQGKPETKWCRDFRELYSMSELTQEEFATRAGVDPGVVNRALNNQTANFQTSSLVRIVKLARTVSGYEVSKMEKYLPLYRRDVTDRTLRAHHISPFVRKMNPIMDAADEQGMKAVEVAQFLHIQPPQMSRLVTGKSEPSQRTCVRLLKLEEKLGRLEESELPKYYEAHFGPLPGRRAK